MVWAMRYGFYLPTRGQTATPEALETLVKRGEKIFRDSDNSCATCHKPPLYTNNKLMPVIGFSASSHNRFEGTAERG